MSEQPDSTVTATRVETPSGFVISCDEIDNEKADTFHHSFLNRLSQIPRLYSLRNIHR